MLQCTFRLFLGKDQIETDEWKVEGKDPLESSVEMLAPNTLLDLLKNYLFYRIEHGSATKVLARYMQYRAAEKYSQTGNRLQYQH